MPKHWKGLEHHLSVPNQKTTYLTFNHAKDINLTLSNNLRIEVTTLLKSLLLRSFHKPQTHKSQISWRKSRTALPPPDKFTNWRKWSRRTLVSTPIIPSQWRNIGHKEEKASQDKNKCCAVSLMPQSETHIEASESITLLRTKLSLVGNLLRSNLQANKETYLGMPNQRCCRIPKMCIIWSQQVIRTANSVTLNRVWQPHPPVWNRNLQRNISQ